MGLYLVPEPELAIADPVHDGCEEFEMELEQECWIQGATRACCKWRNAVAQIGWKIPILCPGGSW